MNFQKILIVIFISFISIRAVASEEDSSLDLDREPESKVISLGSDVSATAYTFKAKHGTVGFFGTAVGVTDDLTIGTSPWLYFYYNSVNLEARLRIGPVTPTRRQALQFDFIKTYNAEPNIFGQYFDYEMEVYWLSYVSTHFINSNYTAHFNLQGMYYRNDKWPFSLRRPWVDRTPLQINVTLLNEVHLVRGFYINAEFGFIGLMQNRAEMLIGMSFEYRLESWLFKAGATQTGTLRAYASPLERADYQTALLSDHQGFSGTLDPDRAKFDYAIHPEATIQYYF